MVWIFGSPRTGSTWLLELLAHPLLLEARDPLGFRAPARLARPVDLVPVNESLLPTHLMPPQPEDPAARDRPWIRVPADTFGDLGAYFFARQFEDVWRPGVRELVRVRFRAHLERTAALYPVDEAALIAIKEPNGSHAAPLMMSVLPSARLIFLCRDGRDVIDSQLSLNAPGGLTAAWRGVATETPEQRIELIREESLNWVARMTETERAYQERPRELRWRVRYEDLVMDPAGCLGAIASWMGLDRDPAAIEAAVEAHAFGSPEQSATGAAATRRAATPGLWRENLSERESALAHEIMGEKLAELGYEVAPELGAVGRASRG
jgi:Sulfotransferase family